jgi:V/A-type H+-transporting ATPase subunit I
MIVKMKRLELLLYYKEREQFLDSLRSLGVVHIEELPENSESPRVSELAGQIRTCERVISSLKKIQKAKEISAVQSRDGDPVEVLKRFEEYEEKREKITQEIAALRKDAAMLQPWGNFEPASVKKLLPAGIKIRFFSMVQKKYDSLDKSKIPLQLISSANGQAFFVVIERGEPLQIDAEEIRLPDVSLSAIQEKIKSLNASLKSIESSMEKMVSSLDLLETFRVEKQNLLNYERAQLSMQGHASGKLLHMKGWVPIDKEKDANSYLQKFSAWYKISEPEPGETVPIKVKNGPFSRLFEPIMKIYSFPDYWELDPTPFFAPFFMIFVGLCLGDLGYGLILTAAGLIGTFLAPKKVRPLTLLITVLGLSTATAGILLNGFFGHTIFGGEGIAEGSAYFSRGVNTFSPLSPIETDHGQQFPMMSFAIVIGIVQLLFGMMLNAINSAIQEGFKSAIQPIASLGMLLTGLMIAAHAQFLEMHQLVIGPLKIGSLLVALSPGLSKVLFFISLALFMLFNNLQMKIFFRPLIGLWELYQYVSGIIGNALSYLRLFALGLAGGLLASAFNYIAFMFITKSDGQVEYGSPMIVATILVLILGHTLNLALSMIGSFVHPLRLTFVEFYGSLGFKGGGKPYNPFKNLKSVQ